MEELSPLERFRVLAALAFGVLVAVVALIAAAQVVDGARVPAILPLAQSFAAKAAVARDLSQARRLTQRALALQPTNAALWLMLARIEASGPGPLSSEAVTLLDRSYLVGPYDPRVLGDRLVFAFNHWDALPPDLKHQVLSEVDTAWSVRDKRATLSAILGAMTSPGRLVYWNELFNLRMADISAWVAQHGPIGRAKPSPGAGAGTGP